jgi:Raf kinase inhibitor-like YbhB/YbcL family protein
MLLALLPVIAVALLAYACSDSDNDGRDAPEPTATQENAPADTQTPAAGAMSLTSSAFADNEPMPVQYTCDGDNISPPLSIGGVPDGTVSLALTVIDIDGPGGAFVHWTVWNIDPATTAVSENTVPQGGGEGTTSRGQPGYFGPCPPSGSHRYVFTLYALDDNIVVIGDEPDTDNIESFLEGHVLATAQLTGTYAR